MQNPFAKFLSSDKEKELQAIRQARKQRIEEDRPKALRTRLNNPYFKKEETPRIDKDFKKWFLRGEGWVYTSIIVVIFGSIGYLIFGTNVFAINNIQIQGTENLSQEEIQGLTQETLNSKFLKLIPLNNYLTFRPVKVEAAIYEGINNQFALESLEVYKKFPNTVEINIKERVPGLTWVDSQENYYYIDPEGVISQTVAQDELNDKFPKIKDPNDIKVELDQQVISEELVNFVLQVENKLPKETHLEIDSYSIPQIQCQEREYVMERVFAEEIAAEENLETKNKKKNIQEKFKAGEIDVDESLELLENLNQGAKDDLSTGTLQSEAKKESVVWDVVYNPVDCDFVAINSEINIQTSEGFEIYCDSKLDLDMQINNLNSVLNEKIDDSGQINYIDLRFPDRVYYK